MSTKLSTKERERRQRVSVACVACRKSHMKCDNGRPCGRCVKKGTAHLCRDAQSKRRGRRPKETKSERTYSLKGKKYSYDQKVTKKSQRSKRRSPRRVNKMKDFINDEYFPEEPTKYSKKMKLYASDAFLGAEEAEMTGFGPAKFDLFSAGSGTCYNSKYSAGSAGAGTFHDEFLVEGSDKEEVVADSHSSDQSSFDDSSDCSMDEMAFEMSLEEASLLLVELSKGRHLC